MPGSNRNYRIISSAQTLWVKLSGPIFFILGAVFFGGMFYFGLFPDISRLLFPNGVSPFLVNLFSGLWTLFGLVSGWWGYRLKRVAVDGDSIYISDYFEEVKLPLSTILDVRQNRWIRQHTITIEFSAGTPWGHKIKFMPKIRFLVPGWFSHPIVGELKDMVYWSKASDRVADQIQRQPPAEPAASRDDGSEPDLKA
jgi:hypothetical protein